VWRGAWLALVSSLCAWCGVVVVAACSSLGVTEARAGGPPRRHLPPARETCPVDRCDVTWSSIEHQGEPCVFTFYCGDLPCEITVTYYAAFPDWRDGHVWRWTVGRLTEAGLRGVYPREYRVAVGVGQLPFRLDATGLRAWVALETVGELRRVMKPASVAPSP